MRAQHTDLNQAILSRRPFVRGTTSRCVCYPIALRILHDPRSSMMLWRLQSSTGLATGRSAGTCMCAVSTLIIKAKESAK